MIIETFSTIYNKELMAFDKAGLLFFIGLIVIGWELCKSFWKVYYKIMQKRVIKLKSTSCRGVVV